MIKVATRKSILAQVQTDYVIELIKNKLNLEATKTLFTTKGDRILDKSLDKIGGKGLFIKELEVAMLNGEADCAVHSMKDMPYKLDDEFEIVATPVREDARDVLISKGKKTLSELKKGAKIGTGSRRRALQLLNIRPDLDIVPIRGNVQTRIDKIEKEGLDGIILAAAGLKRLNLDEYVAEYFDVEKFVPASNQGTLGIECLKNGIYNSELIKLDDENIHFITNVEKYVMRILDGGCHSACCCYAYIDGDRINIIALNEVSGTLKKASIEGKKEDYISLCNDLVKKIV